MPPATYWIPNDRQKGYVTSTTQTDVLTTQSGNILITQSGNQIQVNPNILIPIEATQWSASES